MTLKLEEIGYRVSNWNVWLLVVVVNCKHYNEKLSVHNSPEEEYPHLSVCIVSVQMLCNTLASVRYLPGQQNLET